jgi:hypothetical protein
MAYGFNQREIIRSPNRARDGLGRWVARLWVSIAGGINQIKEDSTQRLVSITGRILQQASLDWQFQSRRDQTSPATLKMGLTSDPGYRFNLGGIISISAG